MLEASQEFSKEDALAFLGVRMPAEYAAITRVLTELKNRAPHVVPGKVLVFGAGPGTAIWSLLEVSFILFSSYLFFFARVLGGWQDLSIIIFCFFVVEYYCFLCIVVLDCFEFEGKDDLRIMY